MESVRSVCADECGGRCCRGTLGFHATSGEMRRLKRLAGGRKVAFEGSSPGPGIARWWLSFPRHGGRCPFLADDNTCSVYEDRPGACQVFPHRPFDYCLLWPTVRAG